MSGTNSTGSMGFPPFPRAPAGSTVSADVFNQAMARLEQAFIQIGQPNPLSFGNYANDAAAAAGGVRKGQYYRQGSLWAFRVT